MKQRRKVAHTSPQPPSARPGWGYALRLMGAAVLATGLGFAAAQLWRGRTPQPAGGTAASEAGPTTFHRDIAPILIEHCAGCHHDGGAGPFALVGYDEARKHASQIADVTQRRLMPPWLPAPGFGDFVGQRFLNRAELEKIQQWVALGAPEGDAKQSPRVPKWSDDWQLGQPDLVIQLAEPYTLDAEGKDVYRNFVIPIPNATRRFVRGVEFRPGHNQAIHHAFMFLDPTRESRRRDALDIAPGFPGLHAPPTVQTPPGQFLSWQPGKMPVLDPPELAWVLETNCDLIIQAHLRPSGKPERVQPSVGLYFSDRPGTKTPFKFGLLKYDLDIPAGESNFVVRESYALPADVDLVKILPHAHYLGRDLQAVATLPDGTRRWLLRIPNWDFNWQGDYTFAQPMFLPAATVLSMTYSFDNSAHNARNPSQPPRRVRYGVNSSDEMAELWFQVLPRGSNALTALEQDQKPRVFHNAIAYNTYLLGLDPDNARAHTEFGRAATFLGRTNDALAHLRRAVQIQPDADDAHYALGLLFRVMNRNGEARTEFEAAIRSNPGHAKAYGNLGLVLLEEGDADGARMAFEAALRLNPEDVIARESLAEISRLNPGAGRR